MQSVTFSCHSQKKLFPSHSKLFRRFHLRTARLRCPLPTVGKPRDTRLKPDEVGNNRVKFMLPGEKMFEHVGTKKHEQKRFSYL